jgi:uncharacterized membrane protein
VDLDADGSADILSGSWPGEIYLFRGAPDGRFADPVILTALDGKPIHVGSASTAYAADWDADGDLDLLIGNISGEVYLVTNERPAAGATGVSPVQASPAACSGSNMRRNAPAGALASQWHPAPEEQPATQDQRNGGAAHAYRFAPPRKLEADGQPIYATGGDAAPVAADWDRDGDLDLLVGTGAGSVLYYRNTGSATQPVLAAPQELLPEGGPGKPTPWGERAKPCVTDWNHDDLPDLLLGEFGAAFAPPLELTTAEQCQRRDAEERLPKLLDQWRAGLDQLRKLQKPARNETDEQRTHRTNRIEALLAQLTQIKQDLTATQETLHRFQPTQQHRGRVWLLLRQATPTAP